MKNKIISLLLLISMSLTLFTPHPVYAANFVYVDGYKFEIIEDDNEQTKLLTVLENGDRVYASYDKENGSMNIETIEYASHFLGVGLGPKEVTEY